MRECLVALASELSNDVVHVLELAHSTDVSAQLLLAELLRALLLRVADQLNEAAFVRSKASHLANKGANERSALGDNALASSELWLDDLGCDLMTLVMADSDSGLRGGCHFSN